MSVSRLFAALLLCVPLVSAALGMDIVAASPEATQKFIVGEMQRWAKVVKENQVKAG